MIKKREKVRIAFLGGGAHTIPSYKALLLTLSARFQITLFSEFNLTDRPNEYQLITVSKIKFRRIRELQFFWLIFREHVKKPFDIIHAHSTYPSGFVGTIISFLFRLPHVVSLDAAEGVGLSDIKFGDLLSSKRVRINKMVINRASVVTVLTAYQKESIINAFNLKREIKVIPRGIDLTRFKFEARDFIEPIQFINVAYVHPVKDQETLLRCFAILQNQLKCSLTLVGEDYMDGAMQKMCYELGIADHVNFIGFVDHKEIQAMYSQAQVLLHTSKYESAAMVVSEAMASGLLVCGTHVGLLADMADKCCVTTPVSDYESLAAKVLNVLNDTKQIRSLIKEGRNWTEKHDLVWTAKQYQTLYNSLVSDQ